MVSGSRGVGRVYGEGRIEGVALRRCLYFESAAGYAAYAAQGLEVSEIIQARALLSLHCGEIPVVRRHAAFHLPPNCRLVGPCKRSPQSLISTGRSWGSACWLAGTDASTHSLPMPHDASDWSEGSAPRSPARPHRLKRGRVPSSWGRKMRAGSGSITSSMDRAMGPILPGACMPCVVARRTAPSSPNFQRLSIGWAQFGID